MRLILLALPLLLALTACQRQEELAPTDTAGGSAYGGGANASYGGYGSSQLPSGGVVSPAMQARLAARPSSIAPGSQQDLQYFASDRILFDTDSVRVNPQGHALIQQVADWMKAYPSVILMVEGHADERGTREYNFALGDQRATAVMNQLQVLGISPARIRGVSYGKERPEIPISQPGAWAQNRRVVLKVFQS